MPLLISTVVMLQAQNRETINRTLKVAVSFVVIMTTSVTRLCFTIQHQTCKTKIKSTTCKTKTMIKTIFLVSDRSGPKTTAGGVLCFRREKTSYVIPGDCLFVRQLSVSRKLKKLMTNFNDFLEGAMCELARTD